MSGPALSYVYRYPFASELLASPVGPRLSLATSGGVAENPFFFRGRLTRPQRTADLLRGLVQVVQSRFHVPPAMLTRVLLEADPVVTSSDDRLRFEVFSACCSAYARVDLLPGAIEGALQGRGTTNVDFNAPMRAALAKIRDADRVELSVGAKAVELNRGTEAVIERKVALPVRWLKGFVEVQSFQARMSPCLEVSGAEAWRFLRSLPRANVKHASWIVPGGKGLRLSQIPAREGACVGGIQRLRVLEDLARHAHRLRVYAHAATQTSAWVLEFEEARFHLVVSPLVWRGFSGEGQALEDVAGAADNTAIPQVQASLKWQARIDLAALAREFSLAPYQVSAALGILGSRGLVGYDLTESAYFHRELPFDLSRIETLQPRLKSARKLLERAGVVLVKQEKDRVEALVAGSGVQHRVRLTDEGGRCTCPWFAKHHGVRGPCKHVLAVQLLLDQK